MADVDPFAAYVEPEPEKAGADPFAQYVAPAPAPAEPSRLERAKAALGSAGRAVVQPFKDIGNSLLSANQAVTGAIFHPVDTFNAIRENPLANAREAMRGVNDNIPFANRAVQAMGGPPASSPEDEAAAIPGARAVGGVAGLPAASMVGGIAAKGIEAAAPVVSKAAKIVGERAQARNATRTYKDLGQSATSTGKAKLMDLGPEEIGKVDREFGISSSPNPPAAVKAARATVGASRDAAFDAISKAGGDVDIGTVTQRLDDLQKDFGSKAATRPFAADAAALRSELMNRYGSTGKVSAKELADQISAIDQGAYGANYANPKTAQIVQRRTAGALREVQAKNLDAVAKLGPEQAAAVQAARDANAKFAALKTMEPIVKAKAVKSEFAPSFVDKVIDHPAQALGHAVKDKVVGTGAAVDNQLAKLAPARAAQGLPGASPALPPVPPVQSNAVPAGRAAALAKLISAARQGATRQQLQAQAEQDGTPPELAANIAMQFGR
jgi:hypothetical protein